MIPLHDDVESWKKHFSTADLVIEAVFEELSVKHRVLKGILMQYYLYCILYHIIIYTFNDTISYNNIYHLYIY